LREEGRRNDQMHGRLLLGTFDICGTWCVLRLTAWEKFIETPDMPKGSNSFV
jgi:hypothetical protein